MGKTHRRAAENPRKRAHRQAQRRLKRLYPGTRLETKMKEGSDA